MSINLLIIGSGLYVSGRGTDAFGTIIPSILDYEKQRKSIGKIIFAIHSDSSQNGLRSKIQEACTYYQVPPPIIEICSLAKEDLNSIVKRHNIHAAIICTPDSTHFDLAQKCVVKKVHTLVVKPLATKTKDHLSLIDLAKSNNVLGMVDFHKRFDLANIKIKDLFKKNKLGQIDHILVTYSQKREIPTHFFKQWVEHTNIFQYLGVHYVDLIYFITGAQPKSVMSLPSGNSLREMGINTPDTIITHIKWALDDHTFSSVHLTSWFDPKSSPAMSNQKIEFIGSNGRIISDQMDRGLSFYSEETPYELINPYFSQPYLNYPGDTPRHLGYGPDTYQCFLNMVQKYSSTNMEKYCSIPTFQDTILSTRVIEASNHSLLESGQWVSL